MKTVLVLLISVTVCCHLALCYQDTSAQDGGNNVKAPIGQTKPSRQKKAIAELFSATRDFISVMRKVTVERESSSVQMGRGNHGLMKIAVPLIAGFKAAAMVVSSLVILKGLLLKSLSFSALAFSVSLGIAFKYLYDKVQGPQGSSSAGGHGFDVQSLYNSYGQSWGGGNDQIWQGSSAVELQGGGHDAYSLSGVGDLQGHFSENVQKVANNTRVPFAAQRKSVPLKTGVKTTVYKTTIKRIDI